MRNADKHSPQSINVRPQNPQPLSLRSDPPQQNAQHWYQVRKRAVARLRVIAGGQYTLIDRGYRGHHARHWMRHEECCCVFLASLQEAYLLDAKLCPFCFPSEVVDMQRYGSVAAVQELVNLMTSGRVTFCSDNILGDPAAQYRWVCETHKCELSSSFVRFIANPDALCKWCEF